MAPKHGPALRLYHEDQDTIAQYEFKYRMRIMKRNIKSYIKGKSKRVHIFTFHNQEAYESAITSNAVINLIEELGFRTLSDDQRRAGEDARTIFVNKLDENFFYNMFHGEDVSYCEKKLFEDMRNKNDNVEKIKL